MSTRGGGMNESPSLEDVICVAGDIRPFKAQDILSTSAMQSIRKALLYAREREHIDEFLTESVKQWLLPPVQQELPPEYRWKVKA